VQGIKAMRQPAGQHVGRAINSQDLRLLAGIAREVEGEFLAKSA